jgi:hypothetical protein
MDAKHTPGPWHWIDGDTDQPYVFGAQNVGRPSLRTVKEYGENKTDIIDGKHYTSFVLPKWVLDAEYVENPADAALIAAAPDLLEALQSARELLANVDGLSKNNICNLASEEVEKIDAAIAKATGSAA